MSSWVNIAVLLKAKNNEGGLSAKAAEGLPFLLSEGLEVTFVPPVLRVPRTGHVETVTEAGPGRYVVHFDTITDRNTAEELEGHYCLVRRADLPEGFDATQEGSLKGFSVIDAHAGVVGSIMRIEENPAHPLLVVATVSGAEVLVPLVEEFLQGINEEACEVHVALPEGLLEL